MSSHEPGPCFSSSTLAVCFYTEAYILLLLKATQSSLVLSYRRMSCSCRLYFLIPLAFHTPRVSLKYSPRAGCYAAGETY